MTTFRIVDPQMVPLEYKDWDGAGLASLYRPLLINHDKIRAMLDQPCETCKGSGKQTRFSEIGWEHYEAECPSCHGSGKPSVPGVERL